MFFRIGKSMNTIKTPNWAQICGSIIFLMGCLLIILSGCTVVLSSSESGTSVGGTSFVMGKLEDEVNIPVPKVERATLAAFKHLALPVVKERGDTLGTELKAEAPDQETIWVSINPLTSSRSKIVIRVGLFGDEARSRQILKAIYRQL